MFGGDVNDLVANEHVNKQRFQQLTLKAGPIMCLKILL